MRLRQVRPVPIVVVPPSYPEEQRYACVHFGAAQYLHTYNHPLAEATTNQNGLSNYLSIPAEKRKPLTIITVKDLSFCLEYRTVEIAGQRIELTEKEFDILALLIMNQRQVKALNSSTISAMRVAFALRSAISFSSCSTSIGSSPLS